MVSNSHLRRFSLLSFLRLFPVLILLFVFSFISLKAIAQENDNPVDQTETASQANEIPDNSTSDNTDSQSKPETSTSTEDSSSGNSDSQSDTSSDSQSDSSTDNTENVSGSETADNDNNETNSENSDSGTPADTNSEQNNESTDGTDAQPQNDQSSESSSDETSPENDAAAEEAKAAEEKRQAEIATLKAMHERILSFNSSEVSLSRDGKTIIWKVQSNAKPAELSQAMTSVLGEKVKAVKNLDSFNTILIESESPSMEALNSAIEFISQVERPERQVFLKVLIAEMQIDENQSVGNHLQLLDKSLGQISELAMSVSSNHSPYSTAVEESVRAGLKLFLLSGRRFRNFLYAQQTNRNFQVISSPQIVATHGKQAQVVVGQEVNVRTSTTVNDGVASIEYGKIPIGLTLKVVPFVHSNGLISMDITQSISSLDTYDQERNLASTFERLITTSANVPVGQTVVLGGIISRRHEDNKAGVPLLSRVPILKKMFDRNDKTEQRVELLVFITPEIADTSRQQQKITSNALNSNSDKMYFKNEIRRQISTPEIRRTKEIKPSSLKPSVKKENSQAAVSPAKSEPKVDDDGKAAAVETAPATRAPTMAELLEASKARKAKLRQTP